METPAAAAIRLREAATVIAKAGVFDAEFYLAYNVDVRRASIDPLAHYLVKGFRERRKPNSFFDPEFYIGATNEVGAEDDPLLRYVKYGEDQGLAPCDLFDPAWYRKAYSLQPGENALGHYLAHKKGAFSPIAEFDAGYYLKTYKDVAAAKIDPFLHFMAYGYKEGRNPSAVFDTKFYLHRHMKADLKENPLSHYRRNRSKGLSFRSSDAEPTIPANVKKFTKSGPDFEERRPIAEDVPRTIKILAYYLTQFHAFPENDRWWGKGFTEWTNLARGLPRFHGHYQPRIPRDSGFYSLNDENTLRDQVKYAKSGGIYGFVYYYYWFNGKRLMHNPLEAFLKDQDIDMPFCLMWANENWTRRWDGHDQEVLISQDYKEEDDEKLIDDFGRHFADRRYIRVQGRPLLMIYRPGLISDAKRTFSRWRSLFQARCGENPVIVMGQSFDSLDPTDFGIDGAIEFPPHKLTKATPLINNELKILDESFSANAYRYEDLVRVSLDEPAPAFPLIKTLVPSWDNDARRQGTGLVVHGSTPKLYEDWLSKLGERARKSPFFGEPFVCVNAWNEWCEGAYLEADLHYGSAYLNATARAATGLTQSLERPRIVLIGHDAFPSGAQMLLLNLGRALKRAYGLEVEFVLLGAGELEAEYSQAAPLSVCHDDEALAQRLAELRQRGFTAAIANTVVSGAAVRLASDSGYRTVLLVHELPKLIRERGLAAVARAGLTAAGQAVFSSAGNRERICEALEIPVAETFLVRPQGSYKQLNYDAAAADAVRKELGIGLDQSLVIGVGYADLRKGFDLFIQLWRLLEGPDSQVHFCWIGDMDPGMREWLGQEIEDASATGSFHMVGFRSELVGFYSAADAFVLTSREDPFPTVALEAMRVGVPILAFDRTGGIPELLEEHRAGIVVPYGAVTVMATELAQLLNGRGDPTLRERARALAVERFSFSAYVSDLLELAAPHLRSVSVVVPNYNYARTIPSRLATIFTQTYPTSEVIVLDDASHDNSVEVIAATAAKHARDIKLLQNTENSGAIYRQWLKGADIASGDFVWIAEADDLSEPSFLRRVVAEMATDSRIVMAFTDSRSIDMAGAPVYSSYKEYYRTVEPNALTKDQIFDGEDFVRRFLSVKNLILNVSSVLWRREALHNALIACEADLSHFKMAGDWRLYVEALLQPGARIAYVAEELNVHRRHAESVTHTLDPDHHMNEIRSMHAITLRKGGFSKKYVDAQRAYQKEIESHLRH